MRGGVQTAPSWTAVLDAAKEWSIPPWKIASYPKPIVWWLRYKVYRDVRILVESERSHG